MTTMLFVTGSVVALLCAAATYLLLGPAVAFLRACALAHPNARSSHTDPTPQGAGIVLVPIVLAGAGLAMTLSGTAPPGGAVHALAVAAGALLLMAVGLADDVRTLSIRVRLAAQIIAAGLVVLTLPTEMRLLPALVPFPVERAVLILGLIWCVNLMNFMDGIDGISAAETTAVTIGVLALVAIGAVPVLLALPAAALLGAVGGFAPWNAPPARVFLGDAGSLPIGLLLATMLLHVAFTGAYAAAMILPLYYLADATITLLRRIMRGEPIWQAHREHFYQQAVRRGHSVRWVLIHVIVLNAALVALAVVSARSETPVASLGALALAIVLVGLALRKLAGPR